MDKVLSSKLGDLLSELSGMTYNNTCSSRL
jgi:hypothetical protein